MKMSFYDVKTRQMVEAEVAGKQTYQANKQTKYAAKGKASDGRNLTRFVSKAVYDSIQV